MPHQLLLEIAWYLSVAAVCLFVCLSTHPNCLQVVAEAGVHSTSGCSFSLFSAGEEKRPSIVLDLCRDV